MKNLTFGLSGRVKAAVINNGIVVSETGWTRNLWLDQGLDRIADTPICQCFEVAAKGTGTTATSETPAGSNTYTIANGTSTLTRSAGARDFTVDDVGKLMRLQNDKEFTITALNSVSSVEVTPNADATSTDKTAVFYHVNQTGLTAEVGRTREYSVTAGENGTETSGQVRTFTRTFIFPTEDTLVEVVPDTNTYSQTGTAVTRVGGTRNFTTDDVGSTITFKDSGLTAVITVWGGATAVTVDVSQSNAAQAITLTKDNEDKTETVTGTYSRSGTTVTRNTGARDFTSNDVGKYIHFLTDNVEAKITVFTNATTVTVDSSGTIAAQSVKLYGFTDYREIGFSHSDETDDNLNVRVLLGSAVRAYVATGLRASDQLKLTYECDLSVEPNTAVSLNLNTVISDPGNLMSGNKNGSYTIESFATSTVSEDGETDLSFPDLEPYYAGFAALSQNTNALDPFGGTTRDLAVSFVSMEADDYVDGTFRRTYQGLFGLNDAVGTAWRSLMIYDPESNTAVFTFLFNAAQKKDGEHTFNIVFRKTWGRDLS
jgi:hypothetical protein